MATIKGTNVLAPVVPFDTADVHPSHEARYGKGGYRTVATLSERDAIPAPRREAGMLVFVTASGGSLWQLSGDLTTWTAFASGGGVVGPPGQAGAKGDKGDPGDPATNLVSSVAGRTGAVTLGKSDVGLANVDNTSDASKPVTTAMQNARDGKAAASHTHTIANVTGLQTALDGKQASGSYASATHGHSISDVTGLQTALDGKQASGSYAASVHTHGISDVTGLQTALDGKQAAGSYAAATHGHAIGDVTGLQTALDGKAATSHTHSASDITSGTIATARLGSGSASASTYLRGDQTWAAVGAGGTKTLAVFTPRNNQPPAANFATLDTRNSIAVLDFDDATKESAVFPAVIPEGASLGSGLVIRIIWMATSATSNACRWEVSLERGNTDLDSDSFDTVATAATTTNGTSGIVSVTEITLTTIDSVAAGELYRLRVARDAANAADTMTGDAELVAVEVRSAA